MNRVHRLSFPAFVGLFVQLKPEGENIFFSSIDSLYQEDAKKNRIFPSGCQLVVSVASANTSSPPHPDRLAIHLRVGKEDFGGATQE